MDILTFKPIIGRALLPYARVGADGRWRVERYVFGRAAKFEDALWSSLDTRITYTVATRRVYYFNFPHSADRLIEDCAEEFGVTLSTAFASLAFLSYAFERFDMLGRRRLPVFDLSTCSLAFVTGVRWREECIRGVY